MPIREFPYDHIAGFAGEYAPPLKLWIPFAGNADSARIICDSTPDCNRVPVQAFSPRRRYSDGKGILLAVYIFRSNIDA